MKEDGIAIIILPIWKRPRRIVFDYDSETKIKRPKMYLLQEIKSLKEPIFPGDLMIDANDLIEAEYAVKIKLKKY